MFFHSLALGLIIVLCCAVLLARSFAKASKATPAAAPAAAPPARQVVPEPPSNNLSTVLAKEVKEETALELPVVPENFKVFAPSDLASLICCVVMCLRVADRRQPRQLAG